jgi:O-antigen ligase
VELGLVSGLVDESLFLSPRDRKIDGLLLGLALCAVPVSIAITETLLAVALAIRVYSLLHRRARPHIPALFWFWLAWATLEVLSWLRSPDAKAGWGEIRHLLLLFGLYLVMPALDRASDRIAVWRGIFITATVSSAFLIGSFVWRLFHYRHELSVAPDPSFYLRNGGLLNHWMVYGTVEILVFAGLLEFWRMYPEERRRLAPMLAVNGLAIILSLTRMLWICCFLLLAIHLVWRRSKWIWALPCLPGALFLLAPGVVRTRVTESFKPDYYSNAERLQMLHVGWKMVLQEPFTGVGPGRVEKLYQSYLSPGDPLPAYHGHLHNNLAQLAAQFGLPVVLAATLFLVLLFKELIERCQSTQDRESQFLCHVSLLGLTGFLAAGLFDYTYGHSLGLILLSFVVLSPLLPVEASEADPVNEGMPGTIA